MKVLLAPILALLLLPTVVGSAAASVAAALPAAPPAGLFAWVPQGGYPDPFPYGECTWWASYNHKVTWGGDARDWIANANKVGAATAETPSVGAIAVYRAGGAYSELGHVAIVIAVDASSYRVSEMHAPTWGAVSNRVLPWPDPAVMGFIPVSAG
jgi:surface antigen